MKKSLKTILSVTMATTVVALGLCACSGGAPSAPVDDRDNVTVIVDGGAGSGVYKAGDECSVTAYVPRGYQFIEWRNYGYPVSYDNPYKFDVDFDITLEAVIEKLPVQTHKVSVVGGFIEGTDNDTVEVEKGQKVIITPAESQSLKFVKWVVDGADVVDRNYSFTVTEDTVITGVYDEYCMVAVNGGTVSGKRSDILLSGSEVTVNTVPDEKQKFKYWYTLNDDYSEKILSQSEEYTFSLNSSIKLYAKYDTLCTITVQNGSDKDSGKTLIDTVADTEYTLTPADAPEGKVFVGWYKDGVKYSLSRELDIHVSTDAVYSAHFNTPTYEYLPTPTSEHNSDKPTSGLIYKEASGTIALDRVGDGGESMFTQSASYVKYNIYDSATADRSKPLGAFKVTLNAGGGSSNAATLSTMDGEASVTVMGGAKNFYVHDHGKFDRVLVKAAGLTTAGEYSFYFAPQLISESAVRLSMENDDAYVLASGEIADIQTEAYTVNATKCATPDNSGSRLLYEEQTNGTCAYDRASSGTMYGATIDHVVWYIYSSPTADKEKDCLGKLRVGVEWGKSSAGGAALVGYIAQADGSDSVDLLRGDKNNYYCTDRGALNRAVQKALGDKYNASTPYYLAFKVVPLTEAQIDSDISSISTVGIRF